MSRIPASLIMAIAATFAHSPTIADPVPPTFDRGRVPARRERQERTNAKPRPHNQRNKKGRP
jgi:hypothetical protein